MRRPIPTTAESYGVVESSLPTMGVAALRELVDPHVGHDSMRFWNRMDGPPAIDFWFGEIRLVRHGVEVTIEVGPCVSLGSLCGMLAERFRAFEDAL